MNGDRDILIAVAIFIGFGLSIHYALVLVTCVAQRCLYSGRRAACRRVLKVLRFIPSRLGNSLADRFEIRIASDEAKTQLALQGVERLLSTATKPPAAALISASLVDICVNAGSYRSAVLAPRRFRWAAKPRRFPELFAIAHINRAEALHNLGRNELALKLLARIRYRSPIAVNGSIALKAWILADDGDPQAARKVFDRIDPRPLCPYYESETRFTRALIELASEDHERAFVAASEGLACAVRSSSERNGLFLLGRIEAQRGNLDQALALYERARSHRYRGQSARGLFELGQLYERMNQPQAARAAYSQANDEDAQSWAAKKCRERLAAFDTRIESAPGNTSG